VATRRRLALLGVALLVVLGELVARIHGDRICSDAPGVFYQADARFGWTHVPGLRGWAAKCDGSTLPAAYAEAGPTGLLDPERPYAKPAGTARMLLLGGNGPEGLGVPPGFRLARLLEGLPDRRRSAPLEVIGAGTGGWALDQDLAWLRGEGLRYAPDVVAVVVDPGSELASLSPVLLAGLNQRVPRKPFFRLQDGALVPRPAPPGAPPPPPVEAFGLLDHLQLWRLLTGRAAHTGPPLAWADAAVPTTADVDAERERVGDLAEAILVAMRDAVAAQGGRLVVVVAPQPSWLRVRGPSDRARLAAIADEAGVPVLDLQQAFDPAIEKRGLFVPGTTRWSAGAHVVAASVLWEFLRSRELLPPGVVAARIPGGGVPSPGAWPGDVLRALWAGRHEPIGLFVQGALLAVVALWAVAPLAPRARDVVAAALGLLLVAVLGGAAAAGVALGLAVVLHAAASLPARWRWLRAVVLLAVLAATIVLPVATAPTGMPRPLAAERVGAALIATLLLVRFAAHAVERPRGRGPAALDAFLAAVFCPATLLGGSLIAPSTWATRRPPGGPVPETPAALRARLAAAAYGLGQVLVGLLALVVATTLLGASDLEIWVTGGAAASVPRLWLWLAETPVKAFLLFFGLIQLGDGFLRALGTVAPPAFARPWSAGDPATFWRRWLVPIAAVVRHDVLGRVRARWLAVPLAFAIAGGAYAWFVLQLLGWRWREVVPVTGYALQAAIGTASVLVAGALHARGVLPATRPAARALARVVTLLVVALGWLAFYLPEPLGLPAFGHVLGRLVGLG